MQPDVTISIICTDNRALLRGCLDSLFATTQRARLEVFVVDNASSDGTSEMLAADFPQVQVIRNETRLGFSTNNNLVLERATGRYAMLLNDDTLVLPDALDLMVEYMDEHASVGALGPRLLTADGTIQQSIDVHWGPLAEAFHPLSRLLRPFDWQPDAPVPTEAIAGACFLVRREVVQEVGPLDTDFDPIYSEEIDWCYRIREAGWPIHHLPSARVVHFGGQTMERTPLVRLELLLRKKALFFRKHYGRGGARTYKVGLFAASLAKGVAWAFLALRRSQRARAMARVQRHWYIARRVLRF